MADATEHNFDGDVVVAGGSAGDGVRDQRALSCQGRVCFGFAHVNKWKTVLFKNLKDVVMKRVNNHLKAPHVV